MAVLWLFIRLERRAGGENLIFWHVWIGGVWEDGGGVLVVVALPVVVVVWDKSKRFVVLVFIWFNWLVGWLFCTVVGCVLVWLFRGWLAGGDDGGVIPPLRGMASELI